MNNLEPSKKERGLSTTGGSFFDLMENFFSDSSLVNKGFGGNFKLDVQDNEKEYVVEAEMPGVKKDELDVELKDNRLTISVKKEEKIDEEDKNYIHKERRTSSMQRSIYLPNSKSQDVKAKLENGLLKLTVMKDTESEDKYKVNIEE